MQDETILCSMFMSSCLSLIDLVVSPLLRTSNSSELSLVEYEIFILTINVSHVIANIFHGILSFPVEPSCWHPESYQGRRQDASATKNSLMEMLCAATEIWSASKHKGQQIPSTIPRICAAALISGYLLESVSIHPLVHPHDFSLALVAVGDLFKMAESVELSDLEYGLVKHATAHCFSLLYNTPFWDLVHKPISPFLLPSLAVGLLFGLSLPLQQLLTFSSLNTNHDVGNDWLKRHMKVDVGYFLENHLSGE